MTIEPTRWLVDHARALPDAGDALDVASGTGRNAFWLAARGLNPLAIDRELARRAPGVRRYWSVVDLSVQVPEGAVPVVEGSPEWWRARLLAEEGARVVALSDSNGAVVNPYGIDVPAAIAHKAEHIRIPVGGALGGVSGAFLASYLGTVNPTERLKARATYGLSAARAEIVEMNRAREVRFDEHLHAPQGCRRQASAQMRAPRRR